MNRPLPRLAPRDKTSHKGDFGRVLLVGGSVGMSGSIALAGLATLRSGAGLVRVAVPDKIQATVAGYEPSYMTWGLPSDVEGRISFASREWLESRWREFPQEFTCLACGPGLGRSRDLDRLVHWLYTSVPLPMVVDADALNALAASPATLEQPGGPRILTPHPGEFRRLVADRFSGADSSEQAVRFAAATGSVVVLKGYPTIVTDGRECVVCSVGNPGMATGGSGDVLTGVIAAMLAQGMSPLDAAHFAVHVHGRAGDLAAAEMGQVGMIASDLLRWLPRAFQDFGETASAVN